MAKTLRLEAGELTDVGRRRERNQDNVTHLIPSDPHMLDEKGALFIVCDGMGGHAAGEVASELGVKTIRDEYYNTPGSDVITAIATAVERANSAIYQHASEHPELAGMGTTCVALVIAGGRAFVVNIGDSRAYIIRNGKMRQVTRDHSWVAEQVRVGLLTEEQARTHSHRNVITRSLGTQPNVTADLFIETMHDGDRVLLCSDGLHGYVDEHEIEQVVTSDREPDTAVHALIDMANDNGGPDNISATLVELINVPAPSSDLRLPDSAIPAEGITQPLPAVGTRAASKSIQAAKAAKARTRSAPMPQRRTSAGASALTNALRVLVAVLIVAIAGGFWYFAFGPYGQQQAANQQLRNDVAQTQQTITRAAGQDPAAALTALGQARDRLVSDLANPNLDAGYRLVGEDVLTNQLQPAVQQTIQRYNSAALVTPVNVGSAQVYQLSCEGAGGQPAALSNVTQLAAMNGRAATVGSSTQILYALSAGHLYQVLIPVANGLPQSGARCIPISLSGVATVVALAGDATTLNVLAEQPNGQYVVMVVTMSGANSDGSPKTASAHRFNVATSGGEAPTLIAVSGASVFVSYARASTGAFGVWEYDSPLAAPPSSGTTKPASPPKPPTGPSHTVLLQRAPVSITYSHGNLYMLDTAGSLSEISANNKYVFSPLPVQIPSPLRPASPADYSVSTPVPTPMPTPASGAAQSSSGTLGASALRGAAPAAAAAVATATPKPVPTATPVPVTPTVASGTLFSKSGSLAIDPAFPDHLLVCDSAQNRLVRLVTSASGPGLGFAAQYAYSAPLAGATQVAVAPAGSQLVVYTWTSSGLAAYTVPETGAGA